ncbi:LapA family protein [Rubellimicrobium sp. CFH 75288]|uniref:LapA family protein n=1 Tax=Rubellimicrobium sp. CFH 75288 TaxID=2697034 RepID=UPI001412B189|nr:LapA family protein [Rubellimicrobium sp. CFH 75288]NAZ35958.1 DUF1049 domain-containing protein [Rubellimicrobium sp. CFH 75288]
MHYLRVAFWGLVALALVTVGLANREIVTLRLLPEGLAQAVGLAGLGTSLPLFLVILFGFTLGLLVGFVWEWIREIPERAAARERGEEILRLRREIALLRGEAGPTADPVEAALAATAPVAAARR